jgi:hypothetical protein
MEELEPQKSGISRRTVTKAMAWAVPVIAIAAPTPAFAISGEPPTVTIGQACKLPGNSQGENCAEVFANCPGLDTEKAYAFPIRIFNDSDQQIYVTEVVVNAVGPLDFAVACTFPALCTVIEAHDTVDLLVFANSNSSANVAAVVTVNLTWGHSVDTTGGTCTLTDSDHTPIVAGPVAIEEFLPCSSNTPFPQGPPTCTPPFYPDESA